MAEDKKQVVVFKIGEETYGADITEVREIIRAAEVTVVPKAPPSVSGVIDLRGKIVPVVDLKKRFGLEDKKSLKNARIMIAEVAGELVGLRIDTAVGVLKVDPSSVESTPDIAVTEEMKAAIVGVAKWKEKLIVLLNLEKVLPAEEVRQMKDLKGV